ncbi:hypothetical protein [Halomonas binhaiensis]|uniref:Uncharacterized protein n=1 Tax=Halomonas binhaiensis TaxID=2562282 RepID=A0A7U3HWN5_9GAMM|nr:hypothetical protein [Halomonas binhaiensis]QRG26794.1 hypothetical protein E4T21_21390 [Halomonas binhaiensis]
MTGLMMREAAACSRRWVLVQIEASRIEQEKSKVGAALAGREVAAP